MRRASNVEKRSRTINVVLEVGGSVIRGGISGECAPRFIMQNPFIGLQRTTKVESKELLSDDIRRNCVESLRDIFVNKFQIRAKDCSVLIIENMFSPRVFRDCLFNSLLDEMQVHAVCFLPDMLMPIVATGCQSGIVVDIGSRESRAICIAHGHPVLCSFVSSPVGLNNAASFFHEHLCESNPAATAALDAPTTRMLFEKTAVAVSEELLAQISDVKYCKMEDSSESVEIIVPGWLRHKCLETLLSGNSSSDEIGGVVGIISSCILKCDADTQKIVLDNIIMTGGGSQVPGLSASVCENIACILNESKTPSFICAQNFKKLKPLFQRTFSLSDKSQIIRQEQVKKLLSSHPFPSSSLTWIGGSLFSTLKVHRDKKFFDRDEYLVRTRPFHSNAKGGGGDEIMRPSAPDWLSLNPIDWRFFGLRQFSKTEETSQKTGMTRLQISPITRSKSASSQGGKSELAL